MLYVILQWKCFSPTPDMYKHVTMHVSWLHSTGYDSSIFFVVVAESIILYFYCLVRKGSVHTHASARSSPFETCICSCVYIHGLQVCILIDSCMQSCSFRLLYMCLLSTCCSDRLNCFFMLHACSLGVLTNLTDLVV